MMCTKTFSLLFLMLCLITADAQSPFLVLQKGHLRKVNSARFSPDGKQLVTTSDDGIIKIWDAFSQKLVTELGGNGVQYTDAYFSNDNKTVVAAPAPVLDIGDIWTEYNNEAFYLWSIESGEQIKTELKGNQTATLSPNGKWLAIHPFKNTKNDFNGDLKSVKDAPVNIYDVTTSKLFKQFTRYQDTTTDAASFIAFASDSTLLITTFTQPNRAVPLYITKYTILNFFTDKEIATYNDSSKTYKGGDWLISPGCKYLFHYGGDLTMNYPTLPIHRAAFTELWDVQHLKMISRLPVAMEHCTFNKKDSAMLMTYLVQKPDTAMASPSTKIVRFRLLDTMQALLPKDEYDNAAVTTTSNGQLYYAIAQMGLYDHDTLCQISVLNNTNHVISRSYIKNQVTAMTFSPNDKFLVTGHIDGNLSLWDFTNSITKEIANSTNVIDPVTQMHVSSVSPKIWYITRTAFAMQSANSIDKLSFIPSPAAMILDAQYLFKDKYSILDLGDNFHSNGTLMIINNDTPSIIKEIPYNSYDYSELLIGKDCNTPEKPGENKRFIKLTYPLLQSFAVKTTSTDILNPRRHMNAPTVTLMFGMLKSNKGTDTVLLFSDGSNIRYNDELRSYIFTYDVPYAIQKAAPKTVIPPISSKPAHLFFPMPLVSDNGKYLIGRFDDENNTNANPAFVFCQDLYGRILFKTPLIFNGENMGPIVNSYITSPNKKLACLLSDPLIAVGAHFARIINAQDGTPLFNLKMNSAGVVNGAEYTPDSKYLYTWCEGGTLTKWDLANGHEVFTMVFFKDHDYAIVLPEGYYFISSRTDAKYLNFKLNGKLYNFSQFDLQFNRPDKVLKAVGSNDERLINEYYKAWQGRIQKNGFTEKDFSNSTLHVPSVTVNTGNIQPFTAVQQLPLTFTVSDSLYNLKSYNIFINDVPLNGINGKQLANASHTANITQTVLLSEGMNKIEMNCTNENAAVSRKEALYVTYAPEKPAIPKTYFIGIGINNYSAHSSFVDLSYCVKDIRDLSTALKQRISDNMVVDTLMNESATKEGILRLKQKLMNTSVDDKVIVSFSGHGMVDPQHPDDFYFVTGNTDVNDPSINGISYAQLEELLDSIPARKKLLLLDACHSGESDGSSNNGINNIPGTKKGSDGNDKNKAGSIEILDVVENSDPSHSSSTDIFKLMKEAFVDIRRNNGAYVLSAAQSNESAGEGGGITNGWFTSCIIAQLQQNNHMSINDLSTKVNECVSAKSGGNQNTDNRQELAEFNWMLW